MYIILSLIIFTAIVLALFYYSVFQYRKNLIIPNDISKQGFSWPVIIQPESWVDPGGTKASIIFFNDSIIIKVDFLNKWKYLFSEIKEVDVNLKLSPDPLLIIVCNDESFRCYFTKSNIKVMLNFFDSKKVLLTSSAKEYLKI